MWLIADGGSTKCDWVLLNSKGNVVLQTQTKGLNPTVFSKNTIKNRITSNKDLSNIFLSVEKLFFFGAGCGTLAPQMRLYEQLQSFFKNAEVVVEEDMKAAALSVTIKPGIICILGTGSNSAYFDGNQTHLKFPSLGYILMDEASGNYFGKQLISDYYYNIMPTDLQTDFKNEFDLDPDTIKSNLYNSETPNTYLASFARFIFGKNQQHAYFYQMLYSGIDLFFKRHVLCFEEATHHPIHFVGSLAYFSSDIIRKVACQHQLEIGQIIKRPIDGLINYYGNRLTNDD
ncbi:MAG: N-acetylglucosamine kinase [Bacteroidota bacterium]